MEKITRVTKLCHISINVLQLLDWWALIILFKQKLVYLVRPEEFANEQTVTNETLKLPPLLITTLATKAKLLRFQLDY